MFSGLVYCADCGNKLHLCRTKSWERHLDNYVCGTYKRKRGECSAHYIRSEVLETLVLENLRKVISHVRNYEADFVQQVTENKMAEQMETLSASKRQLEKQIRRIAEIDSIIKRLYEDNLSGKLSDSRFAKMNADYEQEQQILEASSADLKRTVDICEEQTVNIKSFLKCVRKYTEPSELTPDMLHELVDKIVVHASDKSSGHRTQQVDIYYNFVGKIPLSEEVATRQTARYAVAHHAVCPEHENFFINTLLSPQTFSYFSFKPAGSTYSPSFSTERWIWGSRRLSVLFVLPAAPISCPASTVIPSPIVVFAARPQ